MNYWWDCIALFLKIHCFLNLCFISKSTSYYNKPALNVSTATVFDITRAFMKRGAFRGLQVTIDTKAACCRWHLTRSCIICFVLSPFPQIIAVVCRRSISALMNLLSLYLLFSRPELLNTEGIMLVFFFNWLGGRRANGPFSGRWSTLPISICNTWGAAYALPSMGHCLTLHTVTQQR